MINNSNVFFSVVIPAFNVEKYIDRTISSILSQSFRSVEIIIVNDGSTDNTLAIINRYLDANPQIIVVNHGENSSLHIARCNGVSASSGQYILFLDGDDHFTENAFIELHDVIMNNQGYDLYEFGYMKQPFGKPVLPRAIFEDRFYAFFSDKNRPAHTMWNKAYDAPLLKKSFFAMEKAYMNYVEDLYESIVISYFMRRLFISNKIIVNYRIGNGISTRQKDYNDVIAWLRSTKTVFDLIQDFLNKIELDISIDNLSYALMRLIIIKDISTQQNTEVREQLFFELPEYFEGRIILKFWLARERELFNSLDYKLGRRVLFLLRKIKKYLRLIIHRK